jgi:hypothetical protein
MIDPHDIINLKAADGKTSAFVDFVEIKESIEMQKRGCQIFHSGATGRTRAKVPG